LAGFFKQKLTDAQDYKKQKSGTLSAQAAEILASVKAEDKGALDFPLSTVRRDTATFSKKIKDVQLVLDYANKEQISNDSTLLQALNQMQQGTSKDWADLDVQILQTSQTIAALQIVLPMAISESFVLMSVPMLNMPSAATLLANNGSSKAEYDAWRRSNRKTIDSVRAAFLGNQDDGMRQLTALLQTADKVAGNTLRASLRAGILTQVIGDVIPSVRILLCPVCHGLLEALNDKITNKYTLRKPTP
jgi:hypothetical protein